MPTKNQAVKSELLTSLFQKAAIALLIQTLGIAIAYLMQVLFARWMGAVQYGIYEYVISIGTFLGFLAGLGLPNCLLRFIPKYSIQEDWGKLRGIIWGSWRYVFFSSVLTTCLSIIFVVAWNRYSSRDIAVASFVLGMATIPLWGLARHQREMSRGIKQMALAYLPSTIAFPLLAVAGGFYYRHNLSSASAITVVFLSLGFVLLCQLWLFSRQLPSCKHSQPVYLRKEWFAVALPLLFNDSAFVLLSQTDTLMTGAILGTFQAGIYSAAFKTAAGVSFMLMGVNAIAAPMFATLHTQGDYQGLQKLTSTVARWMFYPTLIFALLLILFGDRILGLFGTEFIAARWSMTVLILGQLVNVGAGSVGYLMEMTGHHQQCAFVLGCSAVLNLILNAILIPLLGILGAAIATAITMALWNIWLHCLVVKHLGIKPSIVFNIFPAPNID